MIFKFNHCFRLCYRPIHLNSKKYQTKTPTKRAVSLLVSSIPDPISCSYEMVFSCTISHYFFYNCVLFRLLLAIFFYLAFSLFILIVISQLACGQWNHNQNYHEQNEIFSLSFFPFLGTIYISQALSTSLIFALLMRSHCYENGKIALTSTLVFHLLTKNQQCIRKKANKKL